MELTESDSTVVAAVVTVATKPSPSSSSSSQPHSRSILAIDLNQIPSPSETLPSPSSSSFTLSPTSLIRSFHDNPPPLEGTPAEIPGGPSPEFCSGCGGSPPEVISDRLVCDGCERAFHVGCAGVGGVQAAAMASMLVGWLCMDCSGEGVASQRWPLGRKNGGARLLDMNASPPSDGDGEIRDSRKLLLGGSTFSGYTCGDPLPYSNFMYSGNGYGVHKASSIATHTVRLDFQDILHHRRFTTRSVEDLGYGSQLGRIRGSDTTFRLPSWNPSGVLRSLREFVSERHGMLEEGWHVEFKQSKNGCESYAVYCAPDGKIFETMSDVACYLGLASNGNTIEPETRSDDGSALRRNGFHLPKRRKLTRLPVGDGFTENRDMFRRCDSNGFSYNLQNEQLSTSKCGKALEVPQTVLEENVANNFHQFHEGLPLQYGDFFILSLGKVDARASYHDASQIWPVGYRSCWHDTITGSLFLCDVTDGGDSGPVFKVRRFSCSALPIPYGSTVLHRQNCVQLSGKDEDERDKVTTSDEELCIDMILSDPCLPVEGDAISWLLSSPNLVNDQKEIDTQPVVHSSCERSEDLLASTSSVGEKIGEFSVDGHSPSLVWSILSQKIVDTCQQIYKQTGCLKFFCKHVEDGISSSHDVMNEKSNLMFSSLDKFCSLSGSLKVPSVVKSDDELESTIEALNNWMNPDRFGLDVEFVQELIEQCPGVHRCLRYKFLRRRNDYLRSPLVRNGLLLINGRSLEQCKKDAALDGLYREYKADGEPVIVNHSRPPGKQLGTKLPSHRVGDCLQVWESLRRFHEILGLEPLNFDELEAELINPWFESLSQLGSCERDSWGGHVASTDGSSIQSEQTSSSSSEIDRPEEDRFIEMETLAMREAHANLALCPYSKCNCVSLKRAHISLLDVLVSELQIKVAAVVDPSIDGEAKSRRGRRRDVDSSILAIRPKLNLLPINELTWPELARRYILAVMSMDGNIDSAESGVHECGKVFRCLQGDGGILCGSLTGVAGIEADALLLADATKRIYGSPSSENDLLILEDEDPEAVSASGKTGVTDGNIPDWAQALEPVRKLPTNVGTRIRKCVYEALEKDPPDWARKILEHSISKEVYKGNASGPTKKAVLSVLADVLSESSQQKTQKEKKKKTIMSISDIIMKQCRILLRRAASADEEKNFCNLLGRNLISSENDDEGLLGSPAMVSRPLDFRTVDLRLAVGVYRGSHETFLEDVRELWRNIRTAHAEHPDLVQLAEKLSQNFEKLYEEEVVTLAGKLKEYSELEQINGEAKKEIEDIIASTKEIPKAPWDEGVCKVCGIDKDDDSVLLCDTCDAEYHTYCLNPPLARIPEGNWYCPSCVSGANILEHTSKVGRIIHQRHRRKYHGEGIRNYLDELARTAAVMEQKEYWEFSVDERILLLKFLCDEVLNSILIRQHLEQSSEMSSDLQQKLRMLYSEWKNLKLREDILANKAAKFGPNIPTVAGEASLEGHIPSISDNVPREKGIVDALDSSNEKIPENAKHLEKNISCNSEVKRPVDSECHKEGIVMVVNEDNASRESHDLLERSSKRQKTSPLHESTLLNPREIRGVDGESFGRDKIHEHGGLSNVCKSEDLQGVNISSGLGNTVATETISCSISEELNAVKKDLSSLQESIASAESQLMKSSVRMEFLGSDSSGRLYWGSVQLGSNPWVIVDGTIALQSGKQGLSLEGSSASCPFVYGRDCSSPTCSQWVSYQSDVEIGELIKSLKDYDPKERELKDSILHWQKVRFHEMHQIGKQDDVPLPESISAEKTDLSNLLVTKASTVLEGKYGPFFQEDKVDNLKKKWKRSRVTNDEKLYRCKCLEPIWHSRHHCLSCHRTFFTAEELNRHNDSKCKPIPSVPGKRKPSDEPSRVLGLRKSEIQPMGMDRVQASKSSVSDFSRLIKFQNERLICPFNFEEISSKFVTNDSIKELVHGIGFIGSGGTPSFVPSVSPYLDDPTLMVAVPRESADVTVNRPKITEKAVGLSDAITHGENILETGQSLRGVREEREKKSIPSKFASSLGMAGDPCCTVPESSLRPLVGRAAQIMRQLKISLLDMEAALPEEALRPSKVHPEKRRLWHAFMKGAETIFEMIQATIVLEDMIKTEYLKNEWWYWSSLSAAAKTSTLSALALRIYALDNAIVYESGNLKPSSDVDQQSMSNLDSSEKSKQGRRANKKRKDSEG